MESPASLALGHPRNCWLVAMGEVPTSLCLNLPMHKMG